VPAETLPAASVVLLPGVRLGPGCRVGEFCLLGDRFQIGHHVLVREANQVSDDVSVGSATVVEDHVRIGHRVRIYSGAFVPEYCLLEDDCWIGQRVSLTNVPYPRCPDVAACLRGVTVRPHAKVGTNATLLPGVVVGEDALVGAGALVTADMPARAVVAGNPARQVGTVETYVPGGSGPPPLSFLSDQPHPRVMDTSSAVKQTLLAGAEGV